MVQDSKDEGGDLKHNRTRRSSDSKETNQTDLAQVHPGQGLLQSSRVDEAFGVDVGVKDKQKIVAVRKID